MFPLGILGEDRQAKNVILESERADFVKSEGCGFQGDMGEGEEVGGEGHCFSGLGVFVGGNFLGLFWLGGKGLGEGGSGDDLERMEDTVEVLS